MTTTPWRVLVADDDPTTRLLMQAALSGGEFALTLVDNGHDALAEFERMAFDIALLDVEMPGLDGFAVGAAIRQRCGAGFPVVLVTGRNDEEFTARAGQLSASRIVKPVDWASLAGRLRTILAHSVG